MLRCSFCVFLILLLLLYNNSVLAIVARELQRSGEWWMTHRLRSRLVEKESGKHLAVTSIALEVLRGQQNKAFCTVSNSESQEY